MQKKSINFAQITAVTVLVILLVGSFIKLSTNPWENSPQKIPGKIECEYYDLGGEGIAYHDEDSINNGSGKLNPANGNYLNEFRKEEGVDISYTKPNKQDNSEFNLVTPAMNQLYVGWTVPNEWINYTVNITQTGTYSIGLNYTSNGEGGILFSLDGKEISGIIKIPSTYHPKDTISWRQWHHWNYISDISKIKLKKGIHTLTLHTKLNGNMNFDFIDFKLIEHN